MLIVRRKMPTPIAVVVHKPAEVKPVQANRRPALAGSAGDLHAQKERAKVEIEKQLKLISNAHRQIDDAQIISEQAHKVVEAQLRLANLTEHTDGVYKAALVEVWSRQSRTIDPKKFKAHVGDIAFWGSIKVSVEKASEHLTEKELAAVSDIQAGRMTGISLKVDKHKTRK